MVPNQRQSATKHSSTRVLANKIYKHSRCEKCKNNASWQISEMFSLYLTNQNSNKAESNSAKNKLNLVWQNIAPDHTGLSELRLTTLDQPHQVALNVQCGVSSDHITPTLQEELSYLPTGCSTPDTPVPRADHLRSQGTESTTKFWAGSATPTGGRLHSQSWLHQIAGSVSPSTSRRVRASSQRNLVRFPPVGLPHPGRTPPGQWRVTETWDCRRWIQCLLWHWLWKDLDWCQPSVHCRSAVPHGTACGNASTPGVCTSRRGHSSSCPGSTWREPLGRADSRTGWPLAGFDLRLSVAVPQQSTHQLFYLFIFI